MARTILIIDRYITTRTLIRNFLESELSDVQVLDAAGLSEAQPIMERHRVHLAIVNDRLAGLERLVHHPPHDPSARLRMEVTTLLLVTGGGEGRADRFRHEGFEHILLSPFSQEQLARQVDLICPPRKLRTSRRYHIPGATALMHWEGRMIPATLLNLSRRGVLCEWRMEDCPDPIDEGNKVRDNAMLPMQLWQGVDIRVEFPDGWDGERLDPIQSRLVGLKVMAWGENEMPCRVRLCWNFLGEATPGILNLESRLEQLHQELASVISPAVVGQIRR